MSEVKHTPGPWKAHRTVSGDYQIRFGGKGGWLAEVFDDDEPVEGRTEADARLIAAAPEMLEALQELFLSYKSLADSGDAGTWRIEDFPEGKKALAAIAKATGAEK